MTAGQKMIALVYTLLVCRLIKTEISSKEIVDTHDGRTSGMVAAWLMEHVVLRKHRAVSFAIGVKDNEYGTNRKSFRIDINIFARDSFVAETLICEVTDF